VRGRPDFAAALAFARDLIRISSLPGEEDVLADRVLQEMEVLGYADVRRDAVGNVIGRIPGGGDGPTVMLSCHLDMVATGAPEAWEHPPLGGVVEGGFLHGRGAMDIKGPLALQTHAAAALAGRLDGDVVVAHTVFEERGGLGMKELLDAGEVAPDLVIVGESTHGDICIGHRGRAEVEVLLQGRAGHASAPGRAANPLELLPPVLEAVAFVAADQPADALLGPATLAVTQVDVLPESRNVIPDRVRVILDWRILPGATAEELLERIRTAIRRRVPRVPEGRSWTVEMATETQTTYTGVDRERGLLTPGFLVADDHPAVTAAARAAGRRYGPGPARIRPWTFATDGGWTCGVHGIPTFGFAPGEERHAHTSTERLALDEAEWALDRYPAVIAAAMEALATAG
jgi:putative selenium metabolism hydrolase